MTTTPEEPFLLPAQPELIALAVTMRPTWDPAELERAIVGARQANWPWERTFAAVFRLLMIRDATPYHLVEAVRDPRKRVTAPGNGPSAEYLAIRAEQARLRAGGDHDAV
jgi:hypothetical protein